MTTLTKDHNNHPARAPLTTRRLHQMRDILSKAAAQRDGGDIGYAMSDAVKLINEAIAAFDAEPVAYMTYKGYLLHAADPKLAEYSDPTPLYDAPAPGFVPAELTRGEYRRRFLMKDNFDDTFRGGWNACRAAMLQGKAEPVSPASQCDELPGLIEGMEVSVDVSTCDADAGHRYFGTVTEVSELDGAKNGYILLVQDAKPNFKPNGNSPVVPDGWIKCSDRMPEENQEVILMDVERGKVQSGMIYEDGQFVDFNELYYEVVNPSHWMPLPAAPQQEVNRG